jgi:hypothetical protein
MCKHNKVHHAITCTNGLWPRQIKAITEHAGAMVASNSHSFLSGAFSHDAETGEVSAVYDVLVPIETASVYEMRTVIEGIRGICMAAAAYSTVRGLNNYVLRKCQDYCYRGFAMTVSPDPWYVAGQDVRISGAGVLEWCIDQDDADAMLKSMSKHKRFKNLSVGRYADEFKKAA